MKKRIIAAVLLSAVLAFSGCGQRGGVGGSALSGTPDVTAPATPDAAPVSPGIGSAPTPVSKRDAIPFEEGQLYAAAYLGYQAIDDWDYYAERYLDSGDIPTHYVSDGDYYLVIPRYDGMSLSLYVEDIETFASTLRFYDPDCGSFIVQCNVSDIFTDITARFEYDGETAEFSPFISLKDGTLMIGERGLDLTKPTADAESDVETDPYVGAYLDEGVGGTSLAISANGDGEYLIWLSIYRLTTIDDAVGWDTDDGIRFTATDASGDSIGGIITLDEQTATVTFTDSTWEYLPNGSWFQYTKFSDG